MGYFDGSNPATNSQGVLMSSVREFELLQAEAEKERAEMAALQIGVDEANTTAHNERFDIETKLLNAAVVGPLKRHFGGADGIDSALSGRFGVQPKRLANRLIDMLQSISEGVDDEGYALPETDPEIVAYFADVMEEDLSGRLIPNATRSNTPASFNDPVANDEAYLRDIKVYLVYSMQPEGWNQVTPVENGCFFSGARKGCFTTQDDALRGVAGARVYVRAHAGLRMTCGRPQPQT